MENKLINELYRINQLMSVDNVIVESVTTPMVRSLQTLFSKISDDVVDTFVIKTGVQATDDALDNIVNKLRTGQTIGKKSLNLLISQIDGSKLAKIFTKSKILLGDDFYDDIIRYEKLLKSDPKKYQDAVNSINAVVDNVPYLKNLPDNLKKSLKLELKSKMDDAVKLSNKTSATHSTIKGVNILSKGFKEGWNAPSLLKGVLNWSKFIPGQDVKGWVIFTRWLFSGTTRSIPKGFQQVWDILVKQGVGKDFAKILAIKITSVGAEVFKRWLYLNGTIFVFNQIVAYVRENGGEENSKRENQNLIELAWKDIQNNWGQFGPRWVWPVATVFKPIIEIINGILKRETPGKIYDKMKAGNLPEQKELDTLNTEIENAGKDKTIIDKIKNKIENTPLGFVVFVKSKGLTILNTYDGVSGQTNEFVSLPNNEQTNNWYFEPAKNTFVPY